MSGNTVQHAALDILCPYYLKSRCMHAYAHAGARSSADISKCNTHDKWQPRAAHQLDKNTICAPALAHDLAQSARVSVVITPPPPGCAAHARAMRIQLFSGQYFPINISRRWRRAGELRRRGEHYLFFPYANRLRGRREGGGFGEFTGNTYFEWHARALERERRTVGVTTE